VPIIKCHIKSPGSARSLKADISLNVGNGVKAVEGIQAYLRAMPPLRPLVLAAKALVKEMPWSMCAQPLLGKEGKLEVKEGK
jgi:DNA polymerase sigma